MYDTMESLTQDDVMTWKGLKITGPLRGEATSQHHNNHSHNRH